MPIPAGPAPGTTLSAWVENTRSLLMTGRVDKINALTAPYTSGVAGPVTIALTPPLAGVAAGTRLSIGTNTFYVISADSTLGNVTAYAGQEATVDASAATGALVRLGPRFTDAEIVAALNADLADLSAPSNGLFSIATVDLTATDLTVGYDLAGVTELIDVVSVRAHNLSSTMKDYGQVNKVDYRLDRNADLAVFPSGYSLQIFNVGGTLIGSSWGTSLLGLGTSMGIRVVYQRGFTALANLTDAQSLSNLPTSCYDLPPIGAAMRLVIPREIRRNFTEDQGDTRRAGEVGAGAIANSYRGLAALRQTRIAAESARLTAAYPDRTW